MKDYLLQIITSAKDNNHARCLLREYLQARILEQLQESGAFQNWAFVGGTALRFLYQLERFSEDLDFSLTTANSESNFAKHLKSIKSAFELEAYAITITAKTEKAVQSAFIKFSGLLYELELSPHASEQISIKIEIDTNPPPAAGLTTSIVRNYVILNLQHYDKPSLFAGKIHALLSRSYVKGRDVYDLLWYLSDKSWPEPNLEFLNNALQQTMPTHPQLTSANWKLALEKQISTFNWSNVINDVRPFIENQKHMQLLNEESLLSLLRR